MANDLNQASQDKMDYGNQILTALDIVLNARDSALAYDKTVQGTITKVVNLDGEY